MEQLKASGRRNPGATSESQRAENPAPTGEQIYRDGKVAEALGRSRTMVVFSVDQSVVEMAAAAAPSTWAVENCRDPHEARAVLGRPAIRLVILDDEAINESTRGWLLDRIHRYAPQALVIYVAASHDPENERRARASRVQYYTAKPLDTNRTLRVLRSFLNASA
jgi:DNA-binding NtrC family response regulator